MACSTTVASNINWPGWVVVVDSGATSGWVSSGEVIDKSILDSTSGSTPSWDSVAVGGSGFAGFLPSCASIMAR